VHTLGTPEWEKDNWSGSQVGPDGYYHPGRGGLVRRGSGGAQGRPPMSPGSITDPYGHTKKTRTKPIRNSDGVLIRKDGRPDMRSQSSAANLRKVHARKEEEKRMEGPTSGLVSATLTSTDGHSPDSHFSHETESTSTQEKRNHIMRKMFPNGVNEERGRLYTAEQYFPRNTDSPSEPKPSMSRSDGSAESERGSRGSSDGDGDETMEDSHPNEEERVRRPVEERIKQVIPDSMPTTQSHTLEASAQVTPAATMSPPTMSPSTMSAPTMSAPTTVTMTGTAQEAA
jgi:hypothetical protein